MTVKTKHLPPVTTVSGEHLIGKFIGDPTGPTLIVVGSLHGNEPGGVLALRKVSSKLESLQRKLRGRVYFLSGNTRALAGGVRFIDSDLNRHWTGQNLSENSLQMAEDHELNELLEIFTGILATAETEVYALDLHSTSADGLPFATVGDTLRNRRFAQKFPVTILLGIEEQLDGTMLEYLNNLGTVTLGFEGGQHNAPETVENHEALIWLALVNAGILAAEDLPGLDEHRRILTDATKKLRLLEVRHREALTPEDEFEMNPGFSNFDAIKRGQVLAKNRRGQMKAVESGLILMPLYQKQGADGFFIGREVAPFWLWLSGVLRKLSRAEFVHLLPGVWRHPAEPESLAVNTRVARFFPLQIFHLLGFRKRRRQDHQLIVSRRKHDTKSPFQRKF